MRVRSISTGARAGMLAVVVALIALIAAASALGTGSAASRQSAAHAAKAAVRSSKRASVPTCVPMTAKAARTAAVARRRTAKRVATKACAGVIPKHYQSLLGESAGSKSAWGSWANIPATLSQPVVLRAKNGTQIGLQLMGATAAQRTSYANGAIFHGTDYDVVDRVTSDSLIQDPIVSRHFGLRTWRWQLNLPVGTAPRIDAAGNVQLGNGLVVKAPVLRDANDHSLPLAVHWTLANTTISLTFDDSSLPLPYAIDPDTTNPQLYYDNFSSTTGNSYWPGYGDQIWFRPAGSGSFNVTFVAIDPEFAVAKVVFPALGSGWTPAAATNDTTATAAGPPVSNGTGNGLLGTYYGSDSPVGAPTTFGGPVVNRIDSQVNLNAPSGATGLTGIPNTGYAVKWQGVVESPTGCTGAYTFSTNSDDGIRVIVGGTTVINDYNTHSTTNDTGNFTMGSNKRYPIEVDFFQNSGQALAQLMWSSTACSAVVSSTPVLIPQNHLYAPTYTQTYSWTAGAATPGTKAVSSTSTYPLTENSGVAPETFTVSADSTAPTGGSISYTGGLQTTTSTAITFAVGTDASSGIASSQLQRQDGTLSTGACSGYGAFANIGAANPTSVYTDNTQTSDHCYLYQLLVTDNVGNVATYTSPTVVMVDANPPTGPTTVNDGTGADIAFTVSATQIQGNYTAATDPGTGVAKYQTCVSTVTGCGSGVVAAWADNGTSLSVTRLLSVTDGALYYVCVRAVDNAGNTGAVTCSNGQRDDRTAPTGPTTVNDSTGADITWLTSTSTISANWSGATDGAGSGVVSYNACVSTATNCGGTVIIPWTNAGNVTTGSIGGQSLTQGQIYYVCVQAVDAVGNVSAASCSNGQTVDTVVPSTPAPVNDGPGADIAFTNDNLQMQANWLASTDATSGLQKYQYCISTTTNCGGTPVTGWTDNGTTASVTKAYGSAIPDGTYYVCVRAYDNASNVSAVSCSNGQLLATAPPTPPSVVNDGATAPDIDYQASTSAIAANWPAGTDAGTGMAKYQYCINTAADCTTGSPVAGWTDNALALSVTKTGLALTTGTTYFVCVRDFDNAGNVSPTVRCSNGVTVDTTPPIASAAVNDGTGADVAWVGAGGTLSGNWTAATDLGSGINKYQYCINAAADCTTGSPLVPWTDDGTSLTVTKSGLSLASGTIYYMCVRAVDNVGNVGPVACSNGAQVDTTPPTTPTPVNDGPGADILYTSNNLQLQANWNASTDSGIGLQKYQYCISTTNNCGGAPITNWTDTSPLTSTSVTQTYGSAIADGTYYVCVRAYDLAANVSTVACSNGQIVETTPPTPPASVADGLAADITYQQSGSTISANWLAGSDGGSGLAKYQYCISSTTSCGGSPIVNWTDTTAALGLSQTKSGLALTDTTKYFVCIRDYDMAGNVSATVTCSNGVTVDTSAPTLPTAVKDGSVAGVDATWDASGSSLSGNWTGSTDATSGLAKYQYCINTSAGCASPVSGPTDTATPAFTATGLSLADGTLYYACARSVDNVGNTSAWACSDGQTVDTTPPTASGTVNDGTGADILYTADNLHLSANWTASSDVTSGVAKYQYCISSVTSCGGSPIVPWTDNAGLSVTKTFGAAVADGPYFVCVRAVDNAGNTGAVACSNGQTIETTPPTPPASVADGLAADVTYQQSQVSISANWPAGSDAGSGLQRYQYCINAAANCGGSPITGWTDVSPLLGLSATQTVASQTSGTKIYVCVRDQDNAGNFSATITCSDGVTIDAQAPGAPTTVNDGTAADITWSTSTSSISGNWAGATDALSGIKDYRYCVNTAPSCISPSPTVSTTTTTGTSFTASASFTDGTQYYVCVIAQDTVGNQSSPACSNGQTVDATPPTTPTPVNDGPGADITYASNNHQIQANWTASTDATSLVAKYQYCVNTAADCTTGSPIKGWTDNGTSTNVTWASVPVIPDGLYYVCVRTVDNAGNTSAVACSNGQTMETTPPTPPASVADGTATDIIWTGSHTTISANWPAGSDAGSGLQKYQYCISTTTNCGGTPLVSWTDNAPLLTTSFTATGLPLAGATRYYVCVRDYDKAGNPSSLTTSTCSDGQTTDWTAPSAVSPVNDGTAADVAWDQSVSTISANWGAATDTGSAGITYEYCISSITSCGGTPIVAWTANLSALTVTKSAALTEGTTYFACVRATDYVGNLGSVACSDGQTVDSVPPTAATPVNDGPGADITFASNDHQIQANWTASTDATSLVAKYQYCINTAADCTTGSPLSGWTDNGTATSVTWASAPVIPDGLYYVCVRAVDNAGNVGPVTCSNGQTMETQPPLPPASVADGAAADITWTNSGTTLSANWPAGTDAGSGVQRYQYCISTVTSCGGAPVVNWTDNAPLLGTSVTKTGLALTDGTKYFVCVRDYDVAGNQSLTSTCSDGQTVDLTAPTVPTSIKDGAAADITWNLSVSSVSGNWTGSTDSPGSGVKGYLYCVNTAASCTAPTPTIALTAVTPASFTAAASLVDGTKYYVCVEAVDNVGNASVAACSDGQTVDATPPPATAGVNDGPAADITYTSVSTQLQANWTAVTDPGAGASGTAKYQYCIATATACGGTSIVAWSDNSPATATTLTKTGLTLTDGIYFTCVRAVDTAGNVGAVACSNGQIVETQPPVIAFSKFDTTGDVYAYWSGGASTKLWFNPAPPTAQNVDVVMHATDAGAGVNHVQFPGLGSGWTPAAGGPDATEDGSPAPVGNGLYRLTYSFGFGAATPGPGLTATGVDNAGNTQSSNAFDVEPDAAAPVGGAITYTDGFDSTSSITLALTAGSDAQSGLGGWQILRAQGSLVAGSCTSISAYAALAGAAGTGSAPATYTDSTLVDQDCYRYELVTTDQVQNSTTYSSLNTVDLDHTPPTGSIVLSAGTPTAYQYLASPTHIFVNTAQAGNFSATVSAAAASGVQSVGFPNLGANWSGAGLVPTAPYTKTFAWTAGAADPGVANATVTSNSLGSLAVPFTVTADTAAPTGGTLTYTGGFQSATTTSVAFTTGSDAGSGFAGTQLQRHSAPLTNGVCGAYGGWSNLGAANAVSPVADSTLASGLCYQYQLLQIDNVGNAAPVSSASSIMVDTTAPTAAAVTIAAGANPQGQYLATANHIFVNTTQSGGFSATVTGTDAESGIQSATLPGLGSGWTPGAGGTVNAAPFTLAYSWAAAAADPGAQSAIAFDGVGLSTTASFTVTADTTPPPAGATISYMNAINSTLTNAVTFTSGPLDTGSGTKDTLLERRSVAYDTATSTCGATYGAWAQIGTANPTSPFTDATVTRSNCYEYELITEDNVGNQTTTTSPSVTIVTADTLPPQPFTVVDPTPVTMPAITDGVGAPGCSSTPTYVSGTPALTWNATVDNESGLNGYDIFVDGTGAAAGTVSAAAMTYTPGTALTDGAHTWGVQAFDMLNNRENSGPDYLHAIRIDTTAPTATLVTPAAAAFTASATPTLTWSATDTNCVARVEVDVDGASAEVASGTETAYTPVVALADGPHTWQVRVYDGGGHITSSVTRTFSVDTTAPAAFNLTTPTAGQTVRGFVNVAWGASSDIGGSGLANYVVYLDGVVNQTVSAATTTATIAGLTAGAHTVLVKALDGVGNVTTSTTSRTITAYAVIPAPVLVTPAAGAAINALPTLTWNWPSDGGPAPTDFDVKIDGAVASNVTYPTVTYAIPSLADGTHTWQIVQHDAYTGTVSSVTRTFILDRVAPTNPGPLMRTVTTVSWPAATDALSGMAKVEFWIDNGGGPALAATLAGSATSYNYGTIADGNYTMFTKAYDNAGNVTTSPTIAVTNDSGPPTAFSLNTPAAAVVPTITDGSSAPACGAVPTFTSTTPTFTWTASSDAVSGLEGYDVYIDGALKTNVAAPGTSWTPGTALTAGAHTWSVVAKDNFGNSQASTPATLNIAIDGAAPTIALGTPAAGGATSNVTPTLTWTSGDDDCRSRVQVTLDGSVVTVGTGTETSYAVPTALSEGSHTWSVKVWDAAGNATASATRTFVVDTIAPTGVTAITPANASSVPESSAFTFTWSAGTDAGSGMDHYDLYVDGVPRQSNIAGTTSAASTVHAGSHTWTIRAFDVAGNYTDFAFTFTATVVLDTTPPAAFHLLTPPNGSTITSGTALTWGASTDFNGIAQYKVYIDGYLTGSVPGGTTSFTPATGAGAPICTADFDGSSTTGCLGAFSYSSPWALGTHSGNSSSGNSLGLDNWNPASGAYTAATTTVTVPAGGAQLGFDSHWNDAATYDGNGKIVNAFDGGTVQISTNGGSTWGNTCLGNQLASFYTTSMRCDYRIVTPDGGYTAILSNSTGVNAQFGDVNAFAGTSAGMVHTTMNLSQFAGTTVMVRFVQATDYCNTSTTQIATNCASLTPPEPTTPSTWDIDNISLDTPALLPGLHSWLIKALDPSGNTTSSIETWAFTL